MTLAVRHWFTTALGAVNHKQLKAAVEAAGYVCEGTANDLTANSRVGLDLALVSLTGPQQTQLQGIIDTHDGTNYEGQQLASADASLAAILVGLEPLSAADAAYALMGRAMARKDGANQATIDGIVDRSTAAAYLTGKPEWVNLTAAAKAWLADQLDMEAVLFQAVILALKK